MNEKFLMFDLATVSLSLLLGTRELLLEGVPEMEPRGHATRRRGFQKARVSIRKARTGRNLEALWLLRTKISTKLKPSKITSTNIHFYTPTMPAKTQEQPFNKHVQPLTRLAKKPLCSILLARSINVGTAPP